MSSQRENYEQTVYSLKMINESSKVSAEAANHGGRAQEFLMRQRGGVHVVSRC